MSIKIFEKNIIIYMTSKLRITYSNSDGLFNHRNNRDKIWMDFSDMRMEIWNEKIVVTHTCNPSYSGGTDQEDCYLKPIPGKWFTGPYLENT
jgi:hypothetical protein